MEEINNQSKFLSIRNLEKIYPNGEKAVYNFNLEIDKNEFIVIVGPSGCGKSTTLRMIAGLEDISSGDIFMEGELLNYKACKDRKMAIVFQSYALYPQMNVFDNIAFPLTINKYPYPILDAKLFAAKELGDKINGLGMNVILEALYTCNHDKALKRNPDENLAARLDISVESAKWLDAMFASYKAEERDTLMTQSDAIKAEFLSQIETNRREEEQAVAEKNILLDENFYELDEKGDKKIEFRKMTSFEIKQKVYETAMTLDLMPYLDKLPKELSGGQMQRVALGRAIVKNVPVFLMDEPLSNLDAKLRLTMRSEIVKLHNKINATTLYVTHDQTEAMTMATRIVVMSRGFVQQIGTPEDIYNNPTNIFVAKFIGSPSMNIFEMNYDKETGVLYNESAKITVKKGFLERYDKFYSNKISKFSSMLDHFDKADGEYIMKVLSATDRQNEIKGKKKDTKKLIANLINKFKKQKEVDQSLSERDIAAQMLEELQSYGKGGQKLFVGIRPERIRIEKYHPEKQYRDVIRLKPTVCELLGAEYNVHFDYCGKSMVGKIDAKEKISTKDEIVVRLSFDDIYVFDPVTGEVI